MLLTCTYCSEMAYAISEEHGFDPHEGKKSKQKPDRIMTSSGSVLAKATKLFAREPILERLCIEVLVCQCLSSLIQFIFLWKVKEAITDDQVRAGWTGNCYAWINGLSGVAQFVVIPATVRHIDPRRLWVFMPAMILLCSMWMLRGQQSLRITATTFMSMKIMEYSLRGVANEMVYASLDYESRFIGKEIIGLFANRFGKSLMAVMLSVYTGQSFVGVETQLVWGSTLFSIFWLVASYRLSFLILHRKVD